MKLSEVFTQLSYGELSQLNLGGSGAGVIDPSNYAQMVAHVNLGLMALYKRFPLKESRLTFALQAGRTTYPMSTAEDVMFMSGDTDFEDDILKIERVYTSRGYEFGLNDLEDVYSCHTPSATVLRVPAEVSAQAASLPDHLKTDSLVVVYRAMHPILEVKGTNYSPTKVELELPYSHLEPLLLFVASRVNNPIGMTQEFHAGNSYAAKYEQSCQQLEIQNLRVDQGSQSNKLQRNGWV